MLIVISIFGVVALAIYTLSYYTHKNKDPDFATSRWSKYSPWTVCAGIAVTTVVLAILGRWGGRALTGYYARRKYDRFAMEWNFQRDRYPGPNGFQDYLRQRTRQQQANALTTSAQASNRMATWKMIDAVSNIIR